jgi:hypothetical protein
MPLTPDLSSLVKPQTTCTEKETVFVQVQCYQPYPMGGYPVTSKDLFGEDGWHFLVVGGFALKPDNFRFAVHHFVPDNKLELWHMGASSEGDGATDFDFVQMNLFVERW